MSRSRRVSWALAGIGLILGFALLWMAQPADVVGLALRARWSGLVVAFAGTAAAMLLRGLRISLLTNRRLGPTRATAVAAASQLATGMLPARLGEVSMIPLLRAAGMPGAIRALSLIVLVRVLDVVAVLLWAAFAVAAIGGRPLLILAALVVVATAFAGAWIGGTRALRWMASRRHPGRRWPRRILRQLLRVRRELLHLARAPVRAGTVVLLSVALWGVIWAVTFALVRSMGLVWAPIPVLLGVVGAAFGSSLPVNAAGNFGTQEGGFAAALVGVGVAPRTALAAGFACHLWGLAFTLVIGGGAAVYLAANRSRERSRPLLASLRTLLSSRRDE